MSTNSEIVICHRCKGSGILVHEELVCYHNGIYNSTTRKCELCDGMGRLKK